MWWLPYAMHWSRPAIIAGLLAIPRRHPCRELAVATTILAAIVMDLFDGATARWMDRHGLPHGSGMAMWWSDHVADMVCIFGALAILGLRATLRADPPPLPAGERGPAERRVTRRWAVAAFALALAGFVLLFARMTPGS